MFEKVIDYIPQELKSNPDIKKKGTVIFAPDGMVPEIVNRMLKNGKLPNIAKLKKHGNYGTTQSAIPPVSLLCWSQVYTGKNPGKTGVIGYWQKEKNSYKYKYNSPNMVDAPDIFDYCRANNKNIVSVGMVGTFPPRPIPGVMVCGTLSTAGSCYTYPSELTEILDKEGYVNRMNMYMQRSDYIDALEKRFTLAKHFQKNCDWDIFMLGIEWTDCVAHYSWIKEFDLIEEVYEIVDRKIGEFISNCHEDTNFILLSDHGQRPRPKKFNPGKFLIDLGLLSVKSKEDIKKEAKLRKQKMKKQLADKISVQGDTLLKKIFLKLFIAAWFVKQSIPFINEKKIPFISKPTMLEDKDVIVPGSFNKIDYKKSKAFFCFTEDGKIGSFFINFFPGLADSPVKNIEEYKSIKKLIIEELKKIKEPETVKPIILRTWEKEQLYSGKYLPQLYDIIYDLHDDYAAYTDERDFFEKPLLFAVDLVRVYHDSTGIFACAGPAFKSNGEQVKIKLLDIFSLICKTLNIPYSKDVDGVIHKNLLKENITDNLELLENEPQTNKSKETLTEEQLSFVKDNLAKMGYMKRDKDK